MNKYNYPIFTLLRSETGKFSFEKRDYKWESEQKEPDLDNPNEWLRKEKRNDPKFLEKSNKFYENILKEQQLDLSKVKVLWVGQSHLDIAWEWRIHQTIQKSIVTYNKAVFHMKNHPAFTFAASQPLTLEYVRQNDPALFSEIQRFVQEGKFELVGGMWVEPDARMPSGESFVRQRLYGQYYYFEHFSKFSEVEWLPDTFGYTLSLPQLIKKSGGKYFFTTKIWGGHSPLNAPWPFVNFIWQSPDGSEILSHVAPQMFGPIESWKQIKERSLLLKISASKKYNYSLEADPITNGEFNSEYVPILPVFYGLGDGGHGPTGEEVALVDALIEKRIGEYSTVHVSFKQIEQYIDRLPVWNDELYFQRHWGTLTTQAFIKKALRYLEWRTAALENITTLVELGGGGSSPQFTFETIWKDICTNQFHDILPGSSIAEVYDDVFDMLFQDFKWIQRIERYCIEQLAFGKEYDDFMGSVTDMEIPIVIINPTPFSIKEVISIAIRPENIEFDQENMNQVDEFELSNNDITQSTEKIIKNETKIKLYVKNIMISESMAQQLKSIRFSNGQISCAEYIASDGNNFDLFLSRPNRIEFITELHPFEIQYGALSEQNLIQNDTKIEEKDQEITLITKTQELSISKKTGTILYWIRNHEENSVKILDNNSGTLNIYGDMGDVWDFADDYKQNKLEIDQQSIKVKIDEHTPLRTKISVTIGFEDLTSKFVVNYIIYNEIDALYIETMIDAKDPSITIKMEYDLAFEAEFSEAEIPFGTINRPTMPKTLYERCRDELNCQTFVCFESKENGTGLALINDGKYGFSTEGKKVELTLLRTARYPKVAAEAWCLEQRRKRIQENDPIPPTSDQYPHLIRQKLVPYFGTRIVNKIHESAHSFNIGTFAEILTPINRKKIPKFHFSNVISTLNPELELISIKKPFRLASIQGKAIIARISNMSNTIVKATIQLDPFFSCKNVDKCDL